MRPEACRGNYLRRHILLIILLCFFLVSAAAARQTADQDDIPEGFVLVPRVGVGIEYGGFIVHQDNYTSQLLRQIEADVLQYHRHILYLKFGENTFFGTPSNQWDFNLLKFRLP